MNTKLSAEVKALKTQGFKSICFWLPAYNVGGGTYYFCQLAMYLKEHTDFNVYYMDYENGYPSQMLKDSDVEILIYRDEDVDFSVKEKCVVVTNSTRVIQLKRMNADNKLLFWHYETAPIGWSLVFLMDETKRFLKLCCDERAMVFHDWSGLDAIMQDCGNEYNFPHLYLPLFLPEKQLTQPSKISNENEINLVWVGRLETEKIHSIYNIITNYAAYQTEKRKVMHIIGDGNFRKNVEQFASKHSKQIEFRFTGTVPKKQLDQYLLRHADIVFGMGLSAIEGAALNIPSVVVKLDTKTIHGDEFWWLFDSKEYCAGILPSQKKRFQIQYSHFRDILDDIYVYGLKEEYGAKCYQYYLKNHASFDDVVTGFLDSIQNCGLTMEKLQACIEYVPYNHLRLRKRKLLMWDLPQKILFK